MRGGVRRAGGEALQKAALGAHELGALRLFVPDERKPFVRDRCRRVLSAIREYDAQNHTNLEQTALVYVKENMEIAAAAKALFSTRTRCATA